MFDVVVTEFHLREQVDGSSPAYLRLCERGCT